jgi:hypothetical protein
MTPLWKRSRLISHSLSYLRKKRSFGWDIHLTNVWGVFEYRDLGGHSMFCTESSMRRFSEMLEKKCIHDKNQCEIKTSLEEE